MRENALINLIFKEFLFKSVFDTGSSKDKVQADTMLEIIKKKGPRQTKYAAGKSQSTSANESRKAAYDLLNNLIKKSPVIMNDFLKNQLDPLMQMIKKPKQWNYQPASSSDRI